MLPRRRDEIGEPVQEGKRREFDDAVGARACGLPPAPRADPVGRLVSGEHVADAGDAAVFAAHHGEPFQREGRPGTVSQQVLEALKIARHVAVDERGAQRRRPMQTDAGIDEVVSQPVPLTAGRRVAIRLEYASEGPEQGSLSLNWDSFTQERQRIPTAFLYPAAAE